MSGSPAPPPPMALCAALLESGGPGLGDAVDLMIQGGTGPALAKCAAEQFLLRAGAPGQGRRMDPGQHDHDGSAAITAVCGTGNTRSAHRDQSDAK